jgi:glycosyltransferase involved in cell wall biosynthesis
VRKPTDSEIRVMRVIARMNIGGPAVQVCTLMRGIDESIFDQRLFTGFCTIEEADYLESVARDIQATRINGLGRRVNIFNDIKAFLTLVKAIREFKPHIIHSHTAKAGLLARTASLVSFHSTIRIHTFHGHLLNGYFGKYKLLFIIIVEKILARYTHHLLAVGQKVRQDLLEAGIGEMNKFGLMPPGVLVENLPSKFESLETLGLNATSLKCAFIGRITQIKRPDRFLDVVAEIKRRGIDIEFLMAGDGELLEKCRERILRDLLPVTILGWQNNIERVLAATDIVILTSDNEGTPLSLIQAGMAGVPVVSTNVGSVSEVVIQNKTGIITSLNISEISDALEKLVCDRDLRVRMGEKAREHTSIKYSADRLVRDHEDLYLSILIGQAKF